MNTIRVEVCVGTQCTLMGAMDILEALTSLQEVDAALDIAVQPVPCRNLCDDGRQAPVVIINGDVLLQTDSESVMARIMALAQQRT